MEHGGPLLRIDRRVRPAGEQLLSPNLRHRIETHALVELRGAYYGFTPPCSRGSTARLCISTPTRPPPPGFTGGSEWDPPPFFQSNDAYTSYLDDLNAHFLAGSRAPRYVMRENIALDGRDPRFESPRYMLEMICRYGR